MKKLFALVALVATLVGCATTKETAPEFDKFNSVVYELNIRQATEEGTFAAPTSVRLLRRVPSQLLRHTCPS